MPKTKNYEYKSRKRKRRLANIAIGFIVICVVILAIFITHTLIAAKYENEQLESKILSQQQQINAMKQTMQNSNVDDLNKEIAKLKSVNQNLQEQKAGLIKYVESKTGVKIKDIVKAKFEVTMYTNAEGGKAPGSKNWGRTGSGHIASRGTVAMHSSIPFHSQVVLKDVPDTWKAKVDIPYEVLDRGGAIGKKAKSGETIYAMDVWTDKGVQEALKWGRRLQEGWIIYIE